METNPKARNPKIPDEESKQGSISASFIPREKKMTEEGTADSKISCLIFCFFVFFRDVDLEIQINCHMLRIWFQSSELNLAPAALGVRPDVNMYEMCVGANDQMIV